MTPESDPNTGTTALATLPPDERARAVLRFDAARAELAELATQSAGITDITNKAGRDECHARRMVLKNRRLDIQKAGKAAREDAQAYTKAVIGVEKELVGLIEPEEDRLNALQDAWDSARERERAEAEAAEAARVQAQQDALATITGALGRLFGADTAALDLALEQLAGFDMDQFDDVFRPAAEQARAEAAAAIRKARDDRAALDAQAEALRVEQERLAAERAEQERIAAEQAEARRLEQEREDAERRAKQEAEDRERAERQAAEDRARQAEREAEQARLDEQRRQLEEQAAEQRRIAEEAEQERQEAARKAEAERVEREESEARQRAEEAAQAEAAAIEAATLRSAAEEALPVLHELAPNHLATRKLAAALSREPQA